VCFKDAECPDWAVKDGTCTKEVGSAGTPYDLQIQVSAGSATTSTGAYDLCVSSIVPVLDAGNVGTTNSCSSVTGQGTITDQYGTAHVTCSGKDYIVQNNVWGASASQTITYGPGTKLKVTNQTGNNSGDAPVSYPSLFIGANNGRSTSGSGLPLAVSSITATGIKTAWTWADNGATGSYNAAYDVWFSTGSGGDPSSAVPSGGYLMVWYHKPTQDQPIGTSVASATISGKNWNVWYGTNSGSGKPCVSYVAPTDVMSLEFNLGAFIRDAVTRGYVKDSWYLTNVYAGFEIWSGGVGVETKDFAVTVP
jgi:endoglucanase